MDFDPVSGLFFGVLNTGSGGSGPSFLATINTNTIPRTINVIGPTNNTLDAIACRGNAVPVELQQFIIE